MSNKAHCQKEEVMRIETFDKERSHLKEVVVNNQVVSSLTVIDYRMRVGSADVKMGAIAHVETKARFRKRGYMRALMEDTVRYMTERGYVMSVVMGIPDFYYRFGYVSCIPNRSLSISTRVAETAAKGSKAAKRFRLRKLRKADGEKILAIYNQNTTGRTCTLARDADYFARYAKAGQEVIVAEGGRQRLVGYAVYNKKGDKVEVFEVAATEDAYPALMRGLAAVAIKRRAGNLLLYLTPDDPFAEFCHRHDCQWTTTHHKNASAMMRIVNQERLFRAIRRDLARRVRQSEFVNSAICLRLKTDIGRTTLKISKGRLELAADRRGPWTAEMSQGQLTQLIVGYRSYLDIIAELNRKVDERVQRLLAVLFPTGYPRVWNVARFEELHLNPDDFSLRKTDAQT